MIASPPPPAVDGSEGETYSPLIKPLKHCPRQQTSDLVHDELSRFFSDLFPTVIIDKDNIHYQLELSDYHEDPIEPPRSLTSYQEIPEDEVYHLLQGWIRMQQALASDQIHPDAKSVLSNFRVPDPRKGIESYRLYEDEGRQKMFIEWGLENEECPAVRLDQALSIILGVPTSRLQSILFTFMMAILPNETIHHSLLEATGEYSREEELVSMQKKTNFFSDPVNRLSTIAAAAIIVIAAILTLQWNNSQPHPKESPVYELKDLTKDAKNPTYRKIAPSSDSNSTITDGYSKPISSMDRDNQNVTPGY
ncbi:hypothetical protein Rhal01_00346 [Rubritalea halochordaticola]|uniref:Uncharacterized protein n=1 Tax=Rubritalea halochordaticola TaxID=714537 RepID=A0ABP9UVF8_9BACT